jgi:pterin-4a-carbinolamine dehydratase
VNSLIAYFETADHHPDVRIAYGEVTFELTRYDLGGKVTERFRHDSAESVINVL